MQLSDVVDVITQHVDPLLWVVTSHAGRTRGGLIATFVHTISTVPDLPRVIVAVARQHHTWKLIDSSGVFALHLLGEGNLDLVVRFGLRSGWDCDKFAGLVVSETAAGVPVLETAILWLDCRVETSLQIGDRTIYVAGVAAAKNGRDGIPLRLERMRECLPKEQREEFDRQLARDREVDAAAIGEWRTKSAGPSPSV